MAHIAMEYVILVPVLIAQIIIFPLTANHLMNYWEDSNRTLALQDVADNLGSTVQQMYFSLNHKTMMTGTVTQKSNLPLYIENYPYTANATLKSILDPAFNSSKVLEIMLRLTTVQISVTTTVILGQNVLWQESTFISNSVDAAIMAQKFANGTILLSFGG